MLLSNAHLPKIMPLILADNVSQWLYYLFICCYTVEVLKVCRTPGPTACSKTNMLHLCLKSSQKGRRKKPMNRPRQPQTCSHPIYSRTLTRVHQTIRYFLLTIFHVSISIRTKHPKQNQMDVVNLLLYSTSAKGL